MEQSHKSLDDVLESSRSMFHGQSTQTIESDLLMLSDDVETDYQELYDYSYEEDDEDSEKGLDEEQ